MCSRRSTQSDDDSAPGAAPQSDNRTASTPTCLGPPTPMAATEEGMELGCGPLRLPCPMDPRVEVSARSGSRRELVVDPDPDPGAEAQVLLLLLPPREAALPLLPSPAAGPGRRSWASMACSSRASEAVAGPSTSTSPPTHAPGAAVAPTHPGSVCWEEVGGGVGWGVVEAGKGQPDAADPEAGL